MMREIWRGPLIVTSNGSCYQHRSHYPNHYLYLGSSTETKKKLFRRHDLSMTCMSKSGPICFGVEHCSDWRTKLFYGSSRLTKSIRVQNTISSIESGLICEEKEEENFMVLKRKVEFKENPNELKPPMRGDFEVYRDSSVSEEMVEVYDAEIHFLEERDEEVLSKRILTLSRCNKVRSALELLMSMELSGLRPNVHACNSLLTCLLRKNWLDDSLRVFDFMKRNEITSGHTYSLILKTIAHKQGCNAAVEMFEKLESECKVMNDWDAVVYNTMMSVCGRENNWIQTEKIWRSMKENNKVGTAVTYRLLVCIFVRCCQNDLAIDAYIEMVQSGLKPAEDAMQAVIGACAKVGNCELALNVFSSMINDGLKPNLIACNTLINLLGKDGKVKLAFKFCDVMKSLGHAPDAYTWNALLGALYRANQHADAVQLFDKIKREQNALINVQLFNVTLMSCQRIGLWETAVQLLWQMEASKLSVSTAAYNHVIGSCEIARKPEVALQVYERMVDQKRTPDTFTYMSLIRSCIQGSLWDEVEEILEVAPNASLYNAAIHGMCSRRHAETAKKLYMRMREMGLKPDGKTRALMLQKLARDSRWRTKRRPTHHRKHIKRRRY